MTKSVYHVTTSKKLWRYVSMGWILPPVRAWRKIGSAERFSKQTGRQIIVRLKRDSSFKPLEGHGGEALISDKPYSFMGGI